jgi:hypothetical protein
MKERAKRRIAKTDEQARTRASEKVAFRVASDIVVQTLGTSLADISQAFGVSSVSVVYWRDPRRRNCPPDDWRDTLAEFASHHVAIRQRQVDGGATVISWLRCRCPGHGIPGVVDADSAPVRSGHGCNNRAE